MIPRRLCDRKSQGPSLLGDSFDPSFPLLNYFRSQQTIYKGGRWCHYTGRSSILDDQQVAAFGEAKELDTNPSCSGKTRRFLSPDVPIVLTTVIREEEG